MIIVDDIEQGSPAWHQARLGIPTASMFKQIVSAGCKQTREGWMTAISKLVAERVFGIPDETYQSDWMTRGHVMEEQAIAAYELIHDVEVRRVGLVYRDDAKDVAFSPDGLIGASGGLEVKSPKPENHIKYLLVGEVPPEYQPQVYGSLWASGLQWWDFMSYHPSLEEFIIRTTTQDAGYQAYARAMDKYMPLFLEELEEATKRFI